MSTDIAIREITEARDQEGWAYVNSTWREASRGSGVCRRMALAEWHRVHVPLLRQVALRSTVLLASPAGEPDVFVGFVAGEPERRLLHYVYVKAVYRELGIATQLLAAHALRVQERAPVRTRGESPRMTHLPAENQACALRVRDWLGGLGYVYSPHQLWAAQEAA